MKLLLIPFLVFTFLFSSCNNKVVLFERDPEEWLYKYVPTYGNELKVETFETDKTPHIADYLYVIDNSSSMGNDIANMKKAILAIPKSKYAADGKIAVMTSMVSNYNDYSQTHAGINDYTGQYLEPGFLDFVYKGSIEKFLNSNAVDTKYQSRFTLRGCSSKWFYPAQKAKSGELCLEAALQNTLKGVGCEPNVNAFEQLLMKAKESGTKLFRDGASVHVIFVSDEEHPGCNNAEITNKVPTLKRLRELVDLTGTTVAGLKLHGIGVDKDKTVADGDRKRPYAISARKLVDESKGTYIPLNSADYTPVIKKLINSGTYDSPVFALEKDPELIAGIKVNGKLTKNYTIKGRSVQVNGLDMSKIYTIEVAYEYKVFIK